MKCFHIAGLKFTKVLPKTQKIFPPSLLPTTLKLLQPKKLSKVFCQKLERVAYSLKNIYVSQSTEVKHLNLIILKMRHFCTYISWNQHLDLETLSTYHTYVITIFPSFIQFQILIAKTNVSEK